MADKWLVWCDRSVSTWCEDKRGAVIAAHVSYEMADRCDYARIIEAPDGTLIQGKELEKLVDEYEATQEERKREARKANPIIAFIDIQHPTDEDRWDVVEWVYKEPMIEHYEELWTVRVGAGRVRVRRPEAS